MKIEEFIERVGGDSQSYGRIVEYLKDGCLELEMQNEQHLTASLQDIQKDIRHYQLPNDMIKVKDIRIKGHLNSDSEFRSIPRMIEEPANKDMDTNIHPGYYTDSRSGDDDGN